LKIEENFKIRRLQGLEKRKKGSKLNRKMANWKRDLNLKRCRKEENENPSGLFEKESVYLLYFSFLCKCGKPIAFTLEFNALTNNASLVTPF